MKKLLLSLLVLSFMEASHAQTVQNYKVKTASNSTDRTIMLDILRASLYKTYEVEFIFAVDHFKVGNNYAWFKGEAKRQDGGKIILGDGEECCHVEALFKKKNGKWYLLENGAFSTDLWYDGIENRYPNAPNEIFH